MRIGSLFSGGGGLELGLSRATGGEVLWQVEIDPFCQKVLAKNFPGVYRDVTDVRQASSKTLTPVDLICGGFPCQDVSGAGKGAGIKEGTRSGLWLEFARAVKELQPSIVIVENVASGKGKWLPKVRQDLHLLGYGTRAFALSAFDVGAPHLRKRIFVYATHSHSHSLRFESRGECRENREDSLQLARAGQAGVTSYSYGMRKSQPERGELYQWGRPSNGSGWTIEPPVCGVAYGVPDGVHRNKLLGNAVHVLCAEVIGRIVAEDWANRQAQESQG